MNKVDTEIAKLLITYPTLYSNRLLAFKEIMTSGNYKWDDNGCLVPYGVDGLSLDNTEGLALLQEKLDTHQKNYDDETLDYMKPMMMKYVLEAQMMLRNYEMLCDNIEVFACEYVYEIDNYRIVSYVLSNLARYWGGSPIDNRPENVDEEWAEAIREWCHQLLPTANGLWGVWNEDTSDFTPHKEAGTFNKIKGILETYRTPKSIEETKRQMVFTKECLDEILAEEEENSKRRCESI